MQVSSATPHSLSSAPPAGLQLATDATFHQVERDVYGVLITDGHAVVHASTKRILVICESSQDTEGVGLNKGAAALSAARNIKACLTGAAPPPTPLLTDNDTLRRVVSGSATPGLSRASLRRYVVVGMRILDDEIAPKWVPDEENPADFLTKWLPGPNLRASLAYVCNSTVWHGLEKLAVTAAAAASRLLRA